MSDLLSIPWDELSGADRSALMWAGAAFLAAFPAALAAVAWVAAWRGSPRFGAPRCRGCKAALRGSELSLPERCPECGKSVIHHGAPAIDYALRSWRFTSFAARFTGGAIAVVLAIGFGWLGGAIVAHIDREARATGQAGAIGVTLVEATTPRMVLDALRFAADAAMDDDAVAREAEAAVRQFEADAIDAERGLALLLDRHDSDDGRRLLVELLGSLAAKGVMSEERVRALMLRVTGAPAVIARDGAIRVVAGSPDLQCDIERVVANGEPVVATVEPEDRGLRLVLPDTLPGGASLTVEWVVAWSPALVSSEGGAQPASSAEPRFRLRGRSVVGPNDALPADVPLFLARQLRPRVDVRSLGRATLVSGRLQAAVDPRRSVDGAWWLEVGGERLAIKGRLGPEALELSIEGVLARTIDELPSSFTILFEPADGGAPTRLEGTRWRRGPAS